MTQFDLRSRFEAIAATVDPGAPRPTDVIEADARKMRRVRRTRWGVGVAAVATVAAVVTVPALVGAPDREVTAPSEPADQDRVLPVDSGACTPTSATGSQHTQLLLVEPDCSTSHVPLEDVTGISYTSMSPDASTVAFVNLHDRGDDELELLDVASGQRRQVATSSDTLGDPVWSPDGSQIAFWRAEGGDTHLFVLELTSGEITQLSAGTTDVFPAWSADGAAVAFNRGGDLWVVDVSTGEERQLSEAPAAVKQPFWGSNNGEFLYALQEIGAGPGPADRFRIVMLDPRTGDLAGRSEVLEGLPSDAVYDDWGIHVAARVLPAGTTVVTTTDYGFTVQSEGTVAGDITVLRGRPSPPRTPPGTTPDGRTYGSLGDGGRPDLIAVVIGRDGVGYVPRPDINDKRQPSSPDEALAWQKRRNPARFPAYADDGVTVVGAFDLGSGNRPRLLTTSTVPPQADRSSIAGTLEVEDDGCTYLDGSAGRRLLIWPWETQLADAAGAPDTIENWLTDSAVARDGEVLTLEVQELDGQRVDGGPCATASAPLYVVGR